MSVVNETMPSSTEETPALTVISRTSFNMKFVSATSFQNSLRTPVHVTLHSDTITGLPNGSGKALASQFWVVRILVLCGRELPFVSAEAAVVWKAVVLIRNLHMEEVTLAGLWASVSTLLCPQHT